MIHSRLPNNVSIKVFYLGNLFIILTGLELKYFFTKYKLNCGISRQMLKKNWKNPGNSSKITKMSLLFPLFGKKNLS